MSRSAGHDRRLRLVVGPCFRRHCFEDVVDVTLREKMRGMIRTVDSSVKMLVVRESKELQIAQC